MNKLIETQKQLTLDSREVAEMVGKNHSDLLRDIRNYIEYLGESNFAFTDFFIPGTYLSIQNKELSKYQITKKGCEFIAHKLTGQKGTVFTASYINKFHELEQKSIAPLQELSPQLQFMINMELRQNQLETAITEARTQVKETKDEIKAIREVISINPKNWRTETSDLIRKIGGKIGDYSKPRRESYALLEERAGLRLSTRLTNKKGRALIAGASKPQADRINYLDVIDEEKRFIEIYIAIVKELAIKYGIA